MSIDNISEVMRRFIASTEALAALGVAIGEQLGKVTIDLALETQIGAEDQLSCKTQRNVDLFSTL
jgi:hypothetical protein